MSRWHVAAIGLAGSWGLWGTALAAEASANYGEIVVYRQGNAIRYPDFDLTYQGKTVTGGEGIFKPGFTRHHFLVASRFGDQTVFWSRGAGDIMETEFHVGGRAFYLDLAPRKNGKHINSSADDLIVHDEAGYRAYRK